MLPPKLGGTPRPPLKPWNEDRSVGTKTGLPQRSPERLSLGTKTGGEGRNRTYLAPINGPTAVLKTAGTTRHPSLSGRIGKEETRLMKNGDTQSLALTISRMASGSGNSPVLSFEYTFLPLTLISNAPPPLGMSSRAFMSGPSVKSLSVRPTACGA